MTNDSLRLPIDPDTELTLLDHEHAPEFMELIDRNRPYLREWLAWLDRTRAVCEYAYRARNLNRIEIRCATGNTASQAVPIALGFQREGLLRDNEWLYDHFVDHEVFSMLAKDWVDA
jgi:RimJ/RimL family protein N-acetyltransferase